MLAVNVQPAALLDFTRRCEKEYGVSIVCSQEDVPMGTAGPIYLAREHLLSDSSPFFMFNSDVICDFPLQSMLAFHQAHGGEGTILVTQVKDPTKYGVVVADERGQIQRFVEKPQDWVGDKINAGIYLFNTDVVQRVENKPTSIERVIFPAIAAERKLYSLTLQGYWMDIGRPHSKLTSHHTSTAPQPATPASASCAHPPDLPDVVGSRWVFRSAEGLPQWSGAALGLHRQVQRRVVESRGGPAGQCAGAPHSEDRQRGNHWAGRRRR